MSNAGEAVREREPPGERMASLCAAILRISASLDVDTVLREIAEAARADRRPLCRDHHHRWLGAA